MLRAVQPSHHDTVKITQHSVIRPNKTTSIRCTVDVFGITAVTSKCVNMYAGCAGDKCSGSTD